MPTLEAPSPKLILKKIEEASKLLGLESESLLEKAGWSERLQTDLKDNEALPPLPRLRTLAETSGLPLEFFLSEYRIPITPARFRAGTPDVEVTEKSNSAYYQRKTILRLATLADLLANAIKKEAVEPFVELRRSLHSKKGDPARLLLEALGIKPRNYPIGPKLIESVTRLGVQIIYTGVYHEANLVGLSWWHRGFLPIIACSTAVSVKRSYFTVAHELMHLLTDVDPGQDGEGYRCAPVPHERGPKEREEELRANQAAACVLMPDEMQSDARTVVGEEGPVAGARQLSNEWEVSAQAVGLRLVNWKLATWPEISVLFEPSDFARAKAKPKKGFSTPERTREVLRLLYDSGVSAGYLSWATGLTLDRVLVDLGRLKPEDSASRVRE